MDLALAPVVLLVRGSDGEAASGEPSRDGDAGSGPACADAEGLAKCLLRAAGVENDSTIATAGPQGDNRATIVDSCGTRYSVQFKAVPAQQSVPQDKHGKQKKRKKKRVHKDGTTKAVLFRGKVELGPRASHGDAAKALLHLAQDDGQGHASKLGLSLCVVDTGASQDKKVARAQRHLDRLAQTEEVLLKRFTAQSNAFVDLRGVGVADSHLVVLRAQILEHKPARVDLSKNELSDASADALCETVQTAETLTWILLEGNPLSTTVKEQVQGHCAINCLKSGARDLDALRSINQRPLGDGGAEVVAKFLSSGPPMASLRVLGMSKCGIGSRGAEALARALASESGRARSVRLLEVYSNLPCKEWAIHFAGLLARNSTLTSIDLGKNGIDDQGAALIQGALEGNTSLEELHLDYNQITDAGALGFAHVLGSCNIHTLWLHGNPVSRTALRQVLAQTQANRKRLLPLPAKHELVSQLEQRSAKLAAQLSEHAQANSNARDPDVLARYCVEFYQKLCPQHARNVVGQTVLACVVQEDQEARELCVVALGVGTRFVDSLLLEGDCERVKDSHAEVVARRNLNRYLATQLAVLERKEEGILAWQQVGDGCKAPVVKDRFRFHLYSSTAPCGAASTTSLSVMQAFRKGGGQTCTPFQAGERHSCTDKVRRWQRDGLQRRSLRRQLPQPVTLASIVIGRKWSPRCAEVFDDIDTGCVARCTSVRLEDLVPSSSQGSRGDSDLSISWALGDVEPCCYDGKTGLTVDSRIVPISPFVLDGELIER